MTVVTLALINLNDEMVAFMVGSGGVCFWGDSQVWKRDWFSFLFVVVVLLTGILLQPL